MNDHGASEAMEFRDTNNCGRKTMDAKVRATIARSATPVVMAMRGQRTTTKNDDKHGDCGTMTVCSQLYTSPAQLSHEADGVQPQQKFGKGPWDQGRMGKFPFLARLWEKIRDAENRG